VEFADGDDQILTDAAGPDKADHGRAAHIDLEPQQGIADEVRQYVWRYRETYLRDPASAGRSKALDGAHVNILHHLSEQLAERTSRVDRDRQYARQGAEPECRDKDQREDNV